MHPKPIQPGLIPPLRLHWHQRGIDLEEDVVKGGAEVRAINTVMAGGFRVVDVLAAGTVEFDVRGVGDVVLAHGQKVLGFADDAGALAEDAAFELFHLSISSAMDIK